MVSLSNLPRQYTEVSTYIIDQLGWLDRLHPALHAKTPRYNCLEGTRVEILKRSLLWSAEFETEPVLWLHGIAGCGKSSVAGTIVEELWKRKMLGAAFFCKRDDPQLNDHKKVLSTLAYSLASMHKPYGKAVVHALKQDHDLAYSNVKHQFQELFVKPLSSLISQPDYRDPLQPFILVIDALDECGTSDEQVSLLYNMIQLFKTVSWIKLLLTSRTTLNIQMFFQRPELSVLEMNLQIETDAKKDIRAFAEAKLLETSHKGIWDGEFMTTEEAATQLTEKSSGLFIWVKTALDFVQGGITRKSQRIRMYSLIESKHSNTSAEKQLDLLYQFVLNDLVDARKDNLQILQAVLGAIVAVSKHQPLSAQSIVQLLDYEISLEEFEDVFVRLQSVLYKDNNQAVRVCHATFLEFLSSEDRSGSLFFIDALAQDAFVLKKCLVFLHKNLKFNICGFQSSYLENSAVHVNVVRKLKRTSAICYSALFWMDHFLAVFSNFCVIDSSLEGSLKSLLSTEKLLYWLEIFSVTNEMRIVSIGLQKLSQVFQVSLLSVVSSMLNFAKINN